MAYVAAQRMSYGSRMCRSYFSAGLLIVACSLVAVSTAKAAQRTGALQPRIVGGSSAHISKFPYEVSVRRKPCSTCAYEHYCGGAIYSTNVIITAANCVRTAIVAQTEVVAGTSYRTGAARDGAIYPVEKFTLHEDATIDIALIHLTLNIPLHVYTTKPVTLATQTPRAGKMALVAGWGQQQESGDYTEQLKEVHVPIMDHEICQSNYFWNDITEYEICAGYALGGADACHGDAGSPLLVDGEMVGIVSWGFGCARPNNPGVYTNVVVLRDWIVGQA